MGSRGRQRFAGRTVAITVHGRVGRSGRAGGRGVEEGVCGIEVVGRHARWMRLAMCAKPPASKRVLYRPRDRTRTVLSRKTRTRPGL